MYTSDKRQHQLRYILLGYFYIIRKITIYKSLVFKNQWSLIYSCIHNTLDSLRNCLFMMKLCIWAFWEWRWHVTMHAHLRFAYGEGHISENWQLHLCLTPWAYSLQCLNLWIMYVYMCQCDGRQLMNFKK